MAGKGIRLADAGYEKPKPLVQVKNKNMLLEAKGINRFLYKSNVAIDNPNLQLIGVLSKSYEA